MKLLQVMFSKIIHFFHYIYIQDMLLDFIISLIFTNMSLFNNLFISNKKSKSRSSFLEEGLKFLCNTII